jgi:hypothetical protein
MSPDPRLFSFNSRQGLFRMRRHGLSMGLDPELLFADPQSVSEA